MKRIAFLGAAVAALSTPEALAEVSGYAGTNYSSTPGENDTWEVSGAAAIGEHFQLDAGYVNFDEFGGGDVWRVGAHAYNRGEKWLYGGYLGLNHYEGSGDQVNEWAGAAQVRYYADRTTLGGEVSYTDSKFFEDLTQTAIEGEARHFFTDNLAAYGEIGFGEIEIDFLGTTYTRDVVTYAAGVEWRPDALPVSFAAKYSNIAVKDGDTADSWSVGVRYNWDGSLFARDRSGPGLSAPDMLLGSLF